MIHVTSVQVADVVGRVHVDCSELDWLGVISGWYHITSDGDSVGLLKVSVRVNGALMAAPCEPDGATTVGTAMGPPSVQLAHRSLAGEGVTCDAQRGNEVACDTWLQGGALQEVVVGDLKDGGAAFGVSEAEWSKAATKATSVCVAERSALDSA